MKRFGLQEERSAGSGTGEKQDNALLFGRGDAFGETSEEVIGTATEKEENMGETGSGEEFTEDILDIYLSEVKAISPLSEKEEEMLVSLAAAGDSAARDRITEGYLMHALTLVKDFMGGPLSVAEMIGISNLALVGAVREHLQQSAAGEKSAAGALERRPLRDTIAEAVRRELGAACEAEKQTGQEENEIAVRANRLTEAARVMAAELGRPATEEELAERMHCPAEEIRTLLNMTMQAM